MSQRRNGMSSPSASPSSRDLPPSRRSQALRPVSPPLQNMRLRNLVYILVFLTTALTAFYAYRLAQHKAAVGGWWNLLLRKPQRSNARFDVPPTGESGRGDRSVEKLIHELATAFGIPATELASAIAVAVRNYVPPASLSSVAAKETGEVVQLLVKGDADMEDKLSNTPGQTPTGDSGVVDGVLEGFVGMDEP